MHTPLTNVMFMELLEKYLLQMLFSRFIACVHLILFDDDNFNQMLDERYRMSLWLKLYTLGKKFFSVAF